MTTKLASSPRDETGGRFLRGPDLALGRKLAPILRRVRWAVRAAGYEIPRVRWRWLADLHYEEASGRTYPVGGAASRSESSCSIWMNVGRMKPGETLTGLADTMLHELAHVISGSFESESHPHQHSDVWGAIYARLYRAYFDRADEGPLYVHYGKDK